MLTPERMSRAWAAYRCIYFLSHLLSFLLDISLDISQIFFSLIKLFLLKLPFRSRAIEENEPAVDFKSGRMMLNNNWESAKAPSDCRKTPKRSDVITDRFRRMNLRREKFYFFEIFVFVFTMWAAFTSDQQKHFDYHFRTTRKRF